LAGFLTIFLDTLAGSFTSAGVRLGGRPLRLGGVIGEIAENTNQQEPNVCAFSSLKLLDLNRLDLDLD
jgi:hypothetical protein